MAKKALSVTLGEGNVLWLTGRAKLAGGNVSETLDRLVTQVRTGRNAFGKHPSVVGLVDLSDDPDLLKADAAVQAMFDESIQRFMVNEDQPRPRPASRRKAGRG